MDERKGVPCKRKVFSVLEQADCTEVNFLQASKTGQSGTVRFLLYNIRYGAGIGRHFHFPLPYAGYLKQTNGNLDRIVSFIKSVEPDVILGGLVADCNAMMVSDDLFDIISCGMDLSWTRDPFDRLLVATAELHEAPLITKDRTILENFAGAVW